MSRVRYTNSKHSTLGVQCSSKGGGTDGHTQGYKNPPVPRQLVGESYIPQVCLQHTQDVVKIFQELGWLVNLEQSEVEPKQVLYFVGYQFDLGPVGSDQHRTVGRAPRTKY